MRAQAASDEVTAAPRALRRSGVAVERSGVAVYFDKSCSIGLAHALSAFSRLLGSIIGWR